MDSINWPALGVIVIVLGALATYITTIERRLGRAMTREEHERSCTTKHNQLITYMSRVEDKIDTNNTEAFNQRERLSRQVNNIQQRVAVLDERLSQQRRDDQAHDATRQLAHQADQDEENVA